VQAVEWVVPDDISELKYACTVPCLHLAMQGTFSVTDASMEAAVLVDDAEAAAAEPVEAGIELATDAGQARVIELEADAANRFLQNGEQIRNIEVTPGETVLFRVDNTAGFTHNFHIGPDSELQVMGGTTDVGIPDWESGIQELEWVVPDDLSNIRFACTIPGHYYLMQGDFTVAA
jgi:uncharacterized cupredoxin-like copper-binding protein